MKKLFALVLAALLLCTMSVSALAAKKTAHPFTLNDEEGGSETVEMVTPGIVFSVVKSDGQNVTVESSRLSWESSATQRIAYIYAPRSGRSVILSKATGKAHTLGRFPTGKIVVVAAKATGKYTGVLYKDRIGWVMTSTLKYPDTSAGVRTGTVVWTDGTADGRHSINLREKTKVSSRKIASVKTGDAVTVYAETNGWYEVDVNGWHGFLKGDYLQVGEEIYTVEEPIVPEEEQPEATPAPEAKPEAQPTEQPIEVIEEEQVEPEADEEPTDEGEPDEEIDEESEEEIDDGSIDEGLFDDEDIDGEYDDTGL